MAQKDIYTLGFLAGGYKAVAQFKGIDLAQFPHRQKKTVPFILCWLDGMLRIGRS
jgi:hypothetical protein